MQALGWIKPAERIFYGFIINGKPFDFPPPGPGFMAFAAAVPAVARSSAGTAAFSWVADWFHGKQGRDHPDPYPVGPARDK